MPVFEYNAWVDEDTYMEEMAKLHKLNPKLDVIEVLFREFQRLQSDSSYRSELVGESRQWLLAEYSVQVVALSMELTVDLAAVCSAYMKTVFKDKSFIEQVSRFTARQAVEFYDSVAKDPSQATVAVGLNPASTTAQEQEEVRQRFVRIKDMRDKFWNWYIGYKHNQFATPIALTMNAQEMEQRQQWGLYLVPRPLRRRGSLRKEVNTGDGFIETVDNIDQFYNLAVECVGLSVETRDRQFRKVFGHGVP
jgi:hypothetical protein